MDSVKASSGGGGGRNGAQIPLVRTQIKIESNAAEKGQAYKLWDLTSDVVTELQRYQDDKKSYMFKIKQLQGAVTVNKLCRVGFVVANNATLKQILPNLADLSYTDAHLFFGRLGAPREGPPGIELKMEYKQSHWVSDPFVTSVFGNTVISDSNDTRIYMICFFAERGPVKVDATLTFILQPVYTTLPSSSGEAAAAAVARKKKAVPKKKASKKKVGQQGGKKKKAPRDRAVYSQKGLGGGVASSTATGTASSSPGLSFGLHSRKKKKSSLLSKKKKHGKASGGLKKKKKSGGATSLSQQSPGGRASSYRSKKASHLKRTVFKKKKSLKL